MMTEPMQSVVEFWYVVGAKVIRYRCELLPKKMINGDEYILKRYADGICKHDGYTSYANLQANLDKEWYRYPTPAYQKAHDNITAQIETHRKLIEMLMQDEERLLEEFRQVRSEC